MSEVRINKTKIMPKVNLIAHTENPEKVVAAAAKLCYSELSGSDLYDGLDEVATRKFLEKLRSFGHLSPFEHASFTFSIEGISRACSHQLVRHRLASYSQRSQRYVKESDFDFVVPPSFKEKTVVAYGQTMTAQELFEKHVIPYVRTTYKLMLEGGVPAEDARFVLPNACETKLVVTMNARELLEVFFAERLCSRAQWEIRTLAASMLREVLPVASILFATAGPECFSKGRCPEGKMSCGKPPKTLHEVYAIALPEGLR